LWPGAESWSTASIFGSCCFNEIGQPHQGSSGVGSGTH
jgi:hypothetical protein